MPIPPFRSDVLPPFLGPTPAGSPALMSPHKATTVELVQRFATSPDRSAILKGFLAFRAAIHAKGITNGFQWLDGSFLEDIDDERPPNDLDLVTLFHRPTGVSTVAEMNVFQSQNTFFKRATAKEDFRCDTFFIDLDVSDSGYTVRASSYFLLLFSHQRVTEQWKGMVEVSLGTFPQDKEAETYLSQAGN